MMRPYVSACAPRLGCGPWEASASKNRGSIDILPRLRTPNETSSNMVASLPRRKVTALLRQNLENLALGGGGLLPPTVTWRVGLSRRQVDLWALVVGMGCAAFLWCLAVMLPWFRN